MATHGFWRTVQIIGWLAFFGWIYLNDFDQLFLAPAQSWILVGGGVILLLVFLAGLFGRGETACADCAPAPRPHWVQLLETAGHFMPLALFLLAGASSLTLPGAGAGGSAANIRVLMPQTWNAFPERAYLGPGEYHPGTLIDLYASDHFDDDFPVEMVGRIYRLSPEERAEFTTGEGGVDAPRALLYRYAMACCAADSAPLSAVLEYDQAEALTADAWVRVRGRTTLFSVDPKIPTIRVESIEPVAEPARPYLSWLQAIP